MQTQTNTKGIGILALGTLTLGTLTLGVVQPVQADTVLGIYAGAQAWNPDGDGSLGTAGDTQGELDFDDDNQNVFYLALEHPVPLLPNIKLRRTELESAGEGNVNFTFNGQSFSGDIIGDMDFSHNELTLYYEVLDNWISLDLGLSARQFDGHVAVSQSDGSNREQVDFDGYLPTFYAAARAELPLTGLSLGGEFGGLAIDDSSFYDYQVQLQYNVIDNMALDVGIQLGYRSMQLELDDLDDIDSDLEFSGPYAGLQVHF